MSEEIYITVAKELLDELKKLVESAEQEEEKNTIEVNQEQGDTSSESIKQWYDFNKILEYRKPFILPLIYHD